ncbi:MAG: PKD domain-containing protein [Crocinitomicaceae bacterium]
MMPLHKITTVILSIWMLSMVCYGQSPYVVNGNAFSTSCDCYTLTNALNSQVGSVWNSSQIDLSNSFDMTFDVFLGCSNSGADGMVFALQPVGTTIGTVGGGMGMSGVSPALGIYMDTFQNGLDSDPVADHLTVQTNGDNTHDGSPDDLTPPIILPNLEDCNYHDLQVVWDAPSTQLTVSIDGVLYATVVADIVNTVFSGNPNVYWGFTASTGGLNNEQKFCIQADLLVELSQDSICVNEAYTMADSSVIAGGIVSREWDFGDGSPVETTQNATHAYSAPGTYQLSLDMTDVSGCVYNITNDIVVLEPVIASTRTNSACNACNGSLDIQPSASTGPYQFSVDGGLTFQNNNIFNALCGAQAGQQYNIVVTDMFGCQNTALDSIFDDKPEINTVELANSECQNNTGAVSLGTTTIGGTAPYLYRISGMTNFQALPILNLAPNAPSTYNLVVEDNFGCRDSVAVSIDIIDEPALDPIQFANESCTGSCDGSAIISGTNLVNFSIDNGATYSVSGLFNNLCEGTYDVIVNNDFGCELFDQFTITKPVNIDPVIEANISEGCVPLNVQFSNLSTGQIAESEWSFSDGTVKSVIGTSDVSYEFKQSGLQDVILSITSTDGCIYTKTWASYIDVLAAPKADFTFLPNAPTIYNTEVEFKNASSNDATDWVWDFGPDANPTGSISESPTILFPKGIEASYPVQLTVLNEDGCEHSKSAVVNVSSDVVVFAPNSINASTIQNNSGWRVYLSGIDQYSFHLTLFNRWGEIVWESFNPDAIWDGTYHSGELVPTGTYVYFIQARDYSTDKMHEFNGSINVLK